MRMPKYISPTSLKSFYDKRDEYYINYLSAANPPRQPQTVPMAVGSSFDAYAKSFLVKRLLGVCPPEFEFETIFEAQVQPHVRDAALIDGKTVFDAYTRQGALADLLLDLEGCAGKPRFETTIEGYVTSVAQAIGDIPFLGKPDIYFITKRGAQVIFDWKVNGFYANQGHSPKPGYVRIRTNDKHNGDSHKQAICMVHNGFMISVTHPLNTVEADWAAQLTIYAWLLGEAIGSQFIVAIDQIACDKNKGTFRVAQHRSCVTPEFQQELFLKAHKMWYGIQSGHIFDEMSREESDARCQTLELMAKQMAEPDPDWSLMMDR
jgi:hypothetical protein